MDLLQEFIQEIGDERYTVENPPETLEGLIKHLTSRRVSSYHIGGAIQCHYGRSRSLIDITRIALYYFPETTPEYIARYVAQQLKKGSFNSYYCKDIKRQLIMSGDSCFGGFPDTRGTDPTLTSYYSNTRQLLEQYQNEQPS